MNRDIPNHAVKAVARNADGKILFFNVIQQRAL